MPMLCEEDQYLLCLRGIQGRAGNACGLEKPTASVAVTEAGKAKPLIDSLTEQIKKLKK